MHAPCPNPCSECPFLKTSLRGWLGEWEGPAELSAHVLAGNKFPCHPTMNDRSDYLDMFEDMDEEPDDNLIEDLILIDSTQCKGSLLYKEKCWPDAVEHSSTPAQLDKILSREDFMKHHDRAEIFAQPRHADNN